MEITNVTNRTASFAGSVTVSEGAIVSDKGFVWSLLPNPTLQTTHVYRAGVGTGTFTTEATLLSKNTEYFVRAFATVGEDTVYSEGRSFITTNDCENVVYSGDVLPINQDQIDEFGSIGYCAIDGYLRISDVGNFPPITDLSPLSSIENVEFLFIDNNYWLENLDGLENLTSSLGVEIRHNNRLVEIDGLKNLSAPNVKVVIKYNDALENLDGLIGLTGLGYNLIALLVEENRSLINIDGLQNVISTRGRIMIRGNDNLENIEGLKNLQTVNGELTIHTNQNLQSLQGLRSLRHIQKDLYIVFNDNLAILNGLENLERVENLDIIFNYALSDLCALTGLVASGGVSGNYRVDGNAYNPSQQDILDGNCSQ